MTDDERNPAPSLWEIFKVFVFIGLTAFGGGASAHIHHAIVSRKKWVDDKRMLEGMTVSRIIPGTNVSNLAAFVGSLLAGYKGAAVAVCGVVLPGIIIVLGLAAVYVRLARTGHSLQTSLHGLAAGAVGIMASLAINATRPVLRSPGGLLCAAAAFVGVGIFEINMLIVLVVLVPVASFFGRHERAS